MENRHRSTAVLTSVGRREARRADEFSGYAILVLSLGVGVVTMVLDDLAVPTWVWGCILLIWVIAVNLPILGYLRRPGQLLFYGCALLSSWVLLLTTLTFGGMIVVLLIVVAAIGSYLMPMRWVLVVVALNSAVSFAHMRILGAEMAETLAFVGFYLILHLASVFMAFAMMRETQLRAELEQKNLELEAAGVLLEDSAASSERLRISRELHDLIGHQLTVLNLELEAARHREGSHVRRHIDQAAAVAKGLLTDVRSTVGQLRETSPGDLRESLQRLARAVPSLEIHVEVDTGVQADEDVSETLVRAAQEIITNTIKHAEATELNLTVTLDNDTLTLTGTNDGTAPRTITPGHGLTGLRERLELFGGDLTVHTRPHFTVQAQLPMVSDREPQT